MFSAHLVFADINDHSSLDTSERVAQLERFWNVCERHRPPKIEQSTHSFYDVDNDSLMAGFSSLDGMSLGEDVLGWTLKLQTDLLQDAVPTSFAVNLIACQDEIDWSVCEGFVDDPKRLYIPDDIFERHGRVIRSKLVGDALIVTSRLLELAKKVPFPVVFTTFQGGHLHGRPAALFSGGEQSDLRVEDASMHFRLLGGKKASWLTQRKVDAFGLVKRSAVA
jgi:hypothetical protein